MACAVRIIAPEPEGDAAKTRRTALCMAWNARLCEYSPETATCIHANEVVPAPSQPWLHKNVEWDGEIYADGPVFDRGAFCQLGAATTMCCKHWGTSSLFGLPLIGAVWVCGEGQGQG